MEYVSHPRIEPWNVYFLSEPPHIKPLHATQKKTNQKKGPKEKGFFKDKKLDADLLE